MNEIEETTRKYLQLEAELRGKWFAAKAGKLLATADTSKELWVKLRDLRARDSSIGYAPTEEERNAECLYKLLCKP